jgi:hypothetical protein
MVSSGTVNKSDDKRCLNSLAVPVLKINSIRFNVSGEKMFIHSKEWRICISVMGVQMAKVERPVVPTNNVKWNGIFQIGIFEHIL